MIVGVVDVNVNDLERALKTGTSVTTFATNLIPIWAQHIPGIIDNQKYLVALAVRKLGLNYKQCELLMSELCDNIHLTGSLNRVITVNELISVCNKDLLLKALENE